MNLPYHRTFMFYWDGLDCKSFRCPVKRVLRIISVTALVGATTYGVLLLLAANVDFAHMEFMLAKEITDHQKLVRLVTFGSPGNTATDTKEGTEKLEVYWKTKGERP